MSKGDITVGGYLHGRVVTKDLRSLAVTAKAREMPKYWHRYPIGGQVFENTHPTTIALLRRIIEHGEPCRFNLLVYAEHKEGCGSQWH